MAWKFDPFLVDLVWFTPPSDYIDSANINLGSSADSDLLIDTGLRENEGSEIDQGLRVIDGDI